MVVRGNGDGGRGSIDWPGLGPISGTAGRQTLGISLSPRSEHGDLHDPPPLTESNDDVTECRAY